MTSGRHHDFILESRDHLTSCEQSLLALEQAREPAAIQEHLDRSLRAIHSLKGDAGFLGFGTLRSLAHAMENLLEIYRGQRDSPPVRVVETLLSARDRLAALVEDLDHSQTADVSDLLARLRAMENSAATQPAQEIDLDLVAISRSANGRLAGFFQSLAGLGRIVDPQLTFVGDLLTATLPGELRLAARLTSAVSPIDVDRVLAAGSKPQAATGARNTYPLAIDLSATAARGESLVGLLTRLASSGALRDPQLELPTFDLATHVPAGPVVLRGTYQSETSRSELVEALSLRKSNSAAIFDTVGETLRPGAPGPAAPQAPVGRDDSIIDVEGRSPRPSQKAQGVTSDQAERLSSLRVNVELLDRMMTLVGELTLVRNQSLLAFAEIEGTPRAIIQRLNSVTSELQDTVLRTRMQPVGNLFGKFPRMVRDLARQLGKQIEIEMVGREVELDKTVLEQLSDPLTHLIRNSIDHGIESPEERMSRGKPAGGTVTLSATPSDGQVLIEIRDDGRGIDPAAIKFKAVAQRLKTQAELDRMSLRELFSLILLPGFSTAKQVTEVSGRGVGMDVVKTNVEQLEGSLTIDSIPGEGTSMLLRVPLTLAIIPCLIVEVAEERFAVPQRELEEIVCLHPGGKGAIEQTFDAEVFRLRDRLLPIVRFDEVLTRRQPFDAEAKAEIVRNHPPADRDPSRIEYILVLRSRGRRFGLMVDQVRGTQEIVVKPMHPTMKRVGVFSGATLMGDGRVALIANVEGIAEHARCFETEMRTHAVGAAATTRDPREVHRVLVFEYGPREQFALPLVQIRRLELIDTARLERVGEAEFITLDGVATRIVRLDSALNVSACPDQTQMYLILPKFVPEPMGILVSRIVDTDSLAIDLQQARLADPGVLGTAIVRDRLSLFLDIQYLRDKVFGRRETQEQGVGRAAERTTSARRVLLIDDTPFFREIVRRYLEAEGIGVATAVDGEDGLVKLQQESFDLVVCDIEMPNLDGWGFARKARERGCRIPLLALTSLSKSEHEARAIASGFDEFQEKLDHDRLLRTVHQMLDGSSEPVHAGGRP